MLDYIRVLFIRLFYGSTYTLNINGNIVHQWTRLNLLIGEIRKEIIIIEINGKKTKTI